MGYSGGQLADLYREEPVLRAAARIRDRVGDDLKARVQHHTPVAKPPPGAWSEWLRGRKRMPGHLRDSWRVLVYDYGGGRFVVDVFTEDPVAPYVEHNTEPHLIVPREPGGTLRFYDRAGRVQYATVVHHPGTRGQHMMLKALQEVAVSWTRIGEEEIAEMARTYYA